MVFNNTKIIEEAKLVFDKEIEAIRKTRDAIDGNYCSLLKKISQCQGKIIFVAIGKPGHIGNKLAATFASLGLPAFFMHPAEAMHGDLGMVSSEDIVIMMSYSGESTEVISLLPALRQIGCTIIAITGREKSKLAENSNYKFVFPRFEEACYMHLAPTSSTSALLVLGDSIAVVSSHLKHYTKEDFALHHPAGSLGKKLLVRVGDIMHHNQENSYVIEGTSLKDAIIEMTKKGLGIVSIVDNEGKLKGIITDGDLRRLLTKNIDVYKPNVDDVMTRTPKVITVDAKAVDALQIMTDNRIISMPVIDIKNKAVGILLMADIIRTGIVR